jgi:cytochrome c
MRVRSPIAPRRSAAGPATTALLCAAALLTACTKSTTAADGAAPPPAAPPTDAQKKALLATLPAAYQGADLDNGQAKFATCKSCHTVAQGGDTMVGPNLWGVFGRTAGGLKGYHYSDGMKALGGVWTAERINTWITSPRAMVPGTKMTYVGMENPKDRIDVIAYLKTVTTAPGP